MAMHGLSYLPQMSTSYGSAWMLVQQLRVLNAMSTRDVAVEVLRLAPSEGRHGEVSSRSLVDLSWYEDRADEGGMEEGAMDAFWAQELRKRGLDIHAGPLSKVLARDDVVRWCPECLQSGYHAVWFQLASLSHCPLHGMALEERCPHCGAPHLPCALTPRESGVFECHQCGAPCATINPEQWLRKPDFRLAEGRAFGALSRWFRRARSVPVEWPALIRDLHLCGGAEDCAARGAARTAAVLAMVPSKAVQALLHSTRDLESAAFEEEGHSLTSSEYEEITRRARQQVMALVGSHASCTAPVAYLMVGDRKVLSPTVPWDSVCCVKLAYMLWCDRHDSLRQRRRRRAAIPHIDAYSALPAGALQHLWVSDFMETVRVLSEHRCRKAMPSERLAVALGVDPTPELAGAILPPAEGGRKWWVISHAAHNLPPEACSQRGAAGRGGRLVRSPEGESLSAATRAAGVAKQREGTPPGIRKPTMI
jgi:hypothetical protein